MDPLANIDKEVAAWLADTPEEELLRLWRESKPEKYKGTITVSEYMGAIERLMQGAPYNVDVGSETGGDEASVEHTLADEFRSRAIDWILVLPSPHVQRSTAAATRSVQYFVAQVHTTL